MTDYPGEQFPPAVDPDVEPQPDENPEPDYDTEPAREAVPPYDAPRPGGWIKSTTPYAEAAGGGVDDFAADGDTEQAFEASLEEEPADSLDDEPASSFEEAPAPAESAYGGGAVDEGDGEAGHPLVEETMGRLEELRERPVAEHAEVYADLHERLQSALVEADAEYGDRS